MGYTEHFYRRGVVLDKDGYEDTLADAMRIVEVATELGVELVGYSGDNHNVEGLPVVGVDEICLNGAPPENGEDLVVQRVDTDMSMRMPGRSIYNWCKTGRKAYTGVVQAILIALKRSMPEDVMIGSEGRWGYEWKHGPGCNRGLAGTLAGHTECPEDHEDVGGISGRKLYSLAFPHSPEPDAGIFANPIAGTELEGKRFYLPQEMELDLDLPDFYGLPFGIDWWFLQDQAKEVGPDCCAVCGEETDSEAVIKNGRTIATPDGYASAERAVAMCRFCFRHRYAAGKLTFYRFAEGMVTYRKRQVEARQGILL